MPQRRYLPLRAALTYPALEANFPTAQVAVALERCGLKHLIPRLAETERWDHVLSVGEQQRLAFARLLLHRPDWVFMDEATSALDEDMQTSLMNLFTNELAGTTLVSIGIVQASTPSMIAPLTLVDAVGGARLVTKRKPYWV